MDLEIYLLELLDSQENRRRPHGPYLLTHRAGKLLKVCKTAFDLKKVTLAYPYITMMLTCRFLKVQLIILEVKKPSFYSNLLHFGTWNVCSNINLNLWNNHDQLIRFILDPGPSRLFLGSLVSFRSKTY